MLGLIVTIVICLLVTIGLVTALFVSKGWTGGSKSKSKPKTPKSSTQGPTTATTKKGLSFLGWCGGIITIAAAAMIFVIIGLMHDRTLANERIARDTQAAYAAGLATARKVPDTTTTYINVGSDWTPISDPMGLCVKFQRQREVAYQELLADSSTVFIPEKIEPYKTEIKVIGADGSTKDTYKADGYGQFHIPREVIAVRVLGTASPAPFEVMKIKI